MRIIPIALGAASVLLTGCLPSRLPDEVIVALAKAFQCTQMYPEIERYDVDWLGRLKIRYPDGVVVITSPDRFPECGLREGGSIRRTGTRAGETAYAPESLSGSAAGGDGSSRASGTSWWNRLDSRM